MIQISVFREKDRKEIFSQSYSLDELRIGRTGLDVNLSSPQVSRVHAMIRLRNGYLEIDDCASKSGTFVNGMPITQPTQIRENDEIRISEFLLKVRMDHPFLSNKGPLTDRRVLLILLLTLLICLGYLAVLYFSLYK